MSDIPDASDAFKDPVIDKVFRRLMPLLFLVLVASFIDRINIGYAALSMNKDLGLNATAYGLAITAFYIPFILLEVPSTLALQSIGARIWIGRIMITWGIFSSATMFATGPWSLYGFRALVGAAEAGLIPGILLYLTYWFPSAFRARAMSLFLMGMPATTALMAPISGLLLGMNHVMGLSGWRWLFLIEGLPAVLVGILCLCILDDGPQTAKWLAADEKKHLLSKIARDSALGLANGRSDKVLSQIFTPQVLLLSLAYFGICSSLNAVTWTPQVVREMAPSQSFAVVSFLLSLPAVCALVAMVLLAANSDRTRERAWHLCGALAVAVAGWALVALFIAPQVRYVGLSLVSVGSYSGLMLFWTLPTSTFFLSAKARPAGIALINSIGIGGGSALGPFVIGFLKDATGTFTAGFVYVAIVLAIAIGCVTIVARGSRDFGMGTLLKDAG